jgi:hypothetical protein
MLDPAVAVLSLPASDRKRKVVHSRR